MSDGDGIIGKGGKVLDLLERANRLGLIGYALAIAIGVMYWLGQKDARVDREKAMNQYTALVEQCEGFARDQHRKTRAKVDAVEQSLKPPAPPPEPKEE
jgi:hypothetical protein